MAGFLPKKNHKPQAHPHPRPDDRDETPWAPVHDSSIAKIDRIGTTAVATLTVTELSTYEGVALLSELFHDVSHLGASSLVLDMQNLEFMDSVCLGCLIKALNHAVADGGRIAVANVDGHVQDMFRVSRVDRLFPLCHDVPSALSSLDK